MRSLLGLALAGACAWVWADASFANRLADDVVVVEEDAPELVTPAVSEAAVLAPTPVVAGTPAAVSGIGDVSTTLTSLVTDFSAGAIDCSTALTGVNQCVQTLDSQYLGCETMPAWQDCRTQAVEFQSTLPCCQETVISDVLISEQVIGETILEPAIPLEPIPMDQCCLPACEAAPCGFGGGGGCGGGGFGGGGGGLLGPALGAAALTLSLIDDDSGSGGGGGGGYDGT